MKKILSLVLICVLMLGIVACGKNKRTLKYVSPTGKHTIYVEYDSESRPSVKYKGEEIWSATGSGYPEDVTYDVIWLDYDTVKLYYSDDGGSSYDEIVLYLNNLESE